MAIGNRTKNAKTSDNLKLYEKRDERALHLFTNRDEERGRLATFFQTINNDNEELSKPVLNFYGVGGVGKSSLLKHAWKEFKDKHSESHLRLIHLDLDSYKGENISPIELFWKLRLEIYNQSKVQFYLFDLLYMKYKEKNNESVEVKTGPIQDTLEYFGSLSEGVEFLLDGIDQVANASALGKIVGAGIKHIWNKGKENAVAKQFGINKSKFDNLDITQLEDLMPKVFAEELGLSLTKKRDDITIRKVDRHGLKNYKPTLCIALDGYERIPKNVEKFLVENFLTEFLTDPSYTPHVGFIFLGRNELDWSAYNDVLSGLADEEVKWEDYIDDHRLGGLSREYANQFIITAIKLYKEGNKPECANAIDVNQNAILQASKEVSKNEGDSFHPFYLDLCLEAIEKQGERFNPVKHLGKTPKELIHRFLKYLDDGSREWHWAFALANEFDEELFKYLEDEKSIIGSLQSFYRFVGSYSYITPQQNTSSFRFHRLMQKSLLADIASKKEIERNVLKKSVVDKLVAFYDRKLSDRKLESLTEVDIEYYERANEMLLSAINAKTIDLGEADEIRIRWDEPLSSAFFGVRELWLRKWLNLKVELLGDNNSSVAMILDQIVSVLEDQHKYEDAEILLRRSLEIRQSFFNEDRPSVGRTLNRLGYLLLVQGKAEEAREIYDQTRKFEGEDCKDQCLKEAIRLNNTGVLFMVMEKLESAENQLHKSLKEKSKQYGYEDSTLIVSLDNLALVYIKQGRHLSATALLYKSLEIRRQCGRHPIVAEGLNRLALTLVHLDCYKEAEPLLREALDIRLNLFSVKHPETNISAWNLAVILSLQGKLEKEKDLFSEFTNQGSDLRSALLDGLKGEKIRHDPQLDMEEENDDWFWQPDISRDCEKPAKLKNKAIMSDAKSNAEEVDGYKYEDARVRMYLNLEGASLEGTSLEDVSLAGSGVVEINEYELDMSKLNSYEFIVVDDVETVTGGYSLEKDLSIEICRKTYHIFVDADIEQVPDSNTPLFNVLDIIWAWRGKTQVDFLEEEGADSDDYGECPDIEFGQPLSKDDGNIDENKENFPF